MAANAARKALEDETHLSTLLKWPNDLVLTTGKIGGILIEAKTIGEKVTFAVVGIGVNINLTKRQLPPGATSTYIETGKRYDNRKLLQKIIYQMRSKYGNLHKPTTIVNEWWRHCIHRSLAVEITSQHTTLTGITRRLEEDGSLTIEVDEHKIARVRDGSIRLLDQLLP